jgi:hypothetical protein
MKKKAPLKGENCQVLRAKPDSLCVIFGGMLCLNYFGLDYNNYNAIYLFEEKTIMASILSVKYAI